MLVGMNIFCFVSCLISLLPMMPLSSEGLRDSAMLSVMSDRTLLVSDGDKNRLELDGDAMESQNNTPRYIDATRPS